MKTLKLKILLRAGIELIRIYCFFRQKKNKERVVAAILIVPAFLLLVPTFTFSLTIIQSFIFQVALVYGALSIFWVVRRHYRLTVVNFSIYLLLLIKVNAPIEGTYNLADSGESLKVLQFNVLADNQKYRGTLDRIKELNPDFISFQEVSWQWAEELEANLSKSHPYYKVVRHPNDHQGIAIFSKYPIIAEVDLWEGTANIHGCIQIAGQEVNFLTMHTRSPTTWIRWNERNEHIDRARQHVQNTPGEFLVLGDFNTVPWDSKLKYFKSGTKLKDSRKRLTPTYPTWNPFIAQIPIDYIFHSEGIGCRSLDSVKITSDHKAIMGTFKIKGV